MDTRNSSRSTVAGSATGRGSSSPTSTKPLSMNSEDFQALLADREVASQITSRILDSPNCDELLTNDPTEADLTELLGSTSVKILKPS